MKVENLYFKESATGRLIFWTVIFCVFFMGAALSVAFFLPVNEVENEIVEMPTQDSLFVEDDFDERIPKFSFAQMISNELDSGLRMYRDAKSKAAVEWFYLHLTGDRTVSQAILREANKNDIPLSLAFALAYVESRYRPTAVNKNSNESIDRGLFQLNSKSFPHLAEADFFDPDISAKYGMQHLRFCMETGGKEVTALAMYNAGTVRVRKNNTPASTLNYVDKVMRYKTMIEMDFSEEVVALYDRLEENAILAMAK